MTIRLPGIPPSWLDKEVAKAEEKRFSSELDEARKSGRYSLHVAATLIAQAAGPLVSPIKMEERLMLAMQDKSLPVYDMHQKARWDGVIPFFGLLEIYWYDLNNWLDENEPRIDPIFQNPETLVDPTEPDTVMKAESHELWEIKDPRDPEPNESWNRAARYFARQLVKMIRPCLESVTYWQLKLFSR